MSMLSFCWVCIKKAVADDNPHVHSVHVTSVDGTYLCLKHARAKAAQDIKDEQEVQKHLQDILVELEQDAVPTMTYPVIKPPRWGKRRNP